MTKQQLLQQIKKAGVVGAGGAGFPTYKKLDASVDHIIVNGAECEPLLYKDRETMIQGVDGILRGLEIMQQLTDATQVTIAVKQKNEDVLENFRDVATQRGYNFYVYEDVYPAGDEYVLVYEITGRRMPPGGIPLQVDCVVDNTETIINIANAVDKGPTTEKYITITGAVQSPITTIVPVGTTFKDCIELAGGLTTNNPVVLTGGVMMGGVETDLSAPVSKTNGGLIVLPADHYLVRRKTEPRETYTRVGHGQCDQCSLCTELCPRYLLGYPIEPHKVMRTLQMTGESKERVSMWAEHCCECNICSLIACPESLDPKNIIVDAKKLLREANRSFTEQELQSLFRDVHPARKGREVPISTVYQRLGLVPYSRSTPFINSDFKPHEVIIPLDSHIGQPAQPSVKVGERVQKGDMIASVPDDQLGVPAHASIDGRIMMIEARGIHISNNNDEG
ncbi:MAG: NADH dehydrogenase subunit [Caldithrix sp.]|nr:NADH dehydrogenase subunit [Caldithrix sp.]